VSIALLWYFNEAGINNLACLGEDALVIKRLIKALEQCFNHFFLYKRYAEFLDRLAFWNLIA